MLCFIVLLTVLAWHQAEMLPPDMKTAHAHPARGEAKTNAPGIGPSSDKNMGPTSLIDVYMTSPH